MNVSLMSKVSSVIWMVSYKQTKFGKIYVCKQKGQLGRCSAIPPVTKAVRDALNAVIAGTSFEPTLLGWQLIVIIFVALCACAIGGYILFQASNALPGKKNFRVLRYFV